MEKEREKVPEVEVRFAGRLHKYINEWTEITSNPVILSWIKGYKISFITIPRQRNIPLNIIKPGEQKKVKRKIQEMCENGVISRCTHKKGEFLSSYFLIKKSNGKDRFILNLRNLNKYIIAPHFKLEDYRSVKSLLHKGYYLCTVDLRDAYFLVNVDKSSRKYLRFKFGQELYEFNCLPMGLCTAPFIFTKLLKPLLIYLRKQGVMCVAYLDDILVIGKTKQECEYNTIKVYKIISLVGLIVNEEKSNLEPSQQRTFLGFNFDTVNMVMFLPPTKVHLIQKLCKKFMIVKSCTIREFARFVGILVAACPAIKYGWAHTKLFERAKYLALIRNGADYNKTMIIDLEIIEDLGWWLTKVASNHMSIREPIYSFEIFSDASETAWGGFAQGQRTHGFWDIVEREKHINYLELKAAFNALKCFTKNINSIDIIMRIDNTTAVSYINRMGGIKYKDLNRITREIWNYCEEKNIYIFASYINTKDNIIADKESRAGQTETEYELSLNYFELICNKFGVPQVDLFATKLNAKCTKYVSWRPDPDSFCVDAFTISWKEFSFYAFPPFTLISKVVKKIINDQAEGIVVVPKWPGQPWYPVFRDLLVEEPLCLGPCKELILSPFRQPHQLWKTLILEVGHLSGKHFCADPSRNQD